MTEIKQSTLVFDTETTDKPTKAGAPDPVQLAAILYDEDRVEVAALSGLIITEGWKVADGAFGVHGISAERADKYGLWLEDICYIFARMVQVADVIVAHNTPFDASVMRKALDRHMDATKVLDGKTWRCTMRASTPIVGIPKTAAIASKAFKWPKLHEAYKFFFNEELEGAHDALIDTRACARIYFELLSMGDKVDWRAA